MTSPLLALLTLALAGLSGGVAIAAGWRLFRSRSRNAVLYALCCAYAAVAGAAMTGTAALGGPFDPGAALLACGSLPLWLASRELATAPKRYGPARSGAPVFRSSREPLRDGTSSAT